MTVCWRRSAVLAVVLATLVGAAGATAEVLIEDDFEYFPANSGSHAVSPPSGSGAPLNRVWDQPIWWHKSDALRIVCDGTAASGHCYLSENFLSGVQGASELRDHADREPTRWKAPSDEAWIRHFVRWPEGWEWPGHAIHLKLGRLRIADNCRGGPCMQSFWGLASDPNILRWGYDFTLDGRTHCCPTNEVRGRLPGGFQPGRWYCLELYIRHNTRERPADGVMEIYVDGTRIGENRSVNTRGASGPGTFDWRVVTLADNFVGRLRDGAAATERTPAVHFDGFVFATTRPGCVVPGPR
ncbi:MAG: hypothetical protein ACREMR_02700 [Gemmatimonadales bacterium]